MLLPKFELPEEDKQIYDSYIKEIQGRQDIDMLGSDEWYLRYLSFVGLNWRFDF